LQQEHDMDLRFRIRTLMLVAAGVALVCTAIVQFPGAEYLLLILLPLVGPLIGARWAGRRYEAGRLDPMSGGMVGGIVQAVLVSPMLSVVLRAHLALVALPLMALGLVYGFLVGLIVAYGLCVSAPRDPAPGPHRPGTNRAGTALHDLQPTCPADELE